MSYLTIYAHHNFKSIELHNMSITKDDNKSTTKDDNKSTTKLHILKKLKILLFG